MHHDEIYELLLRWAYHNNYVGQEKEILLVFSSLTNKKGLLIDITKLWEIRKLSWV